MVLPWDGQPVGDEQEKGTVLTGNLVGPPSIISARFSTRRRWSKRGKLPEDIDGLDHIRGLGHLDGLSHVPGVHCGQKMEMLLGEAGKLVQQFAAFNRRCIASVNRSGLHLNMYGEVCANPGLPMSGF